MGWKFGKKSIWAIGAWYAAVLTFFLQADVWAAEAKTKIILNGEAIAVFFNDGDSFRVLSGKYKDARARLAGYNTLESYGPVHQWGNWTTKELYVIAKMATRFASRRVWTCTTDGKTDTYGRMLVWCPELAKEQVARGHAHAMSVTDEPADATLIAAQKEAMAARRGIWAHGVPDFILTSIHSKEEDVEGRGTYNRLVSTDDGHSVKWRHNDLYQECANVCQRVYEVHEEKVDEVSKTLAQDPQVTDLIASLTEAELRSVVHEFAKYRHIHRKIAEKNRDQLKRILLTYVEQGRFGPQVEKPSSCMLHVPFQRRFGGNKAVCLK